MKFVILAMGGPYGDPMEEEHYPENAVIAWCRMREKYPKWTCIRADSEEAAFALVKWAYTNGDKLEAYMMEHKCPYKHSYMMDSLSRQIRRGKSSMQWPFRGYPRAGPWDCGNLRATAVCQGWYLASVSRPMMRWQRRHQG